MLGRSLIKTGELSRIVKVNNRVEGVDKTDVEWLDFNTVMICGKRYTVPPLSSFDYGAIDTERYAANDTVPLSEALTKEYTAAELSEFFSGVSEYPITPIVNPVTYSAANERYPIEVLRSGGYSVYRVSDGGYFYVFWVTDHTSGNDEPIVYFSAYLSSVQDPKKFDELEIGISTAEDVKRIDPASELVIRTSDCAVSYSFLNEKKLLSIEYSHDCSLNETDRLQDLIVKDIQVVKRSIAPDNMQYSRYSLILPGDFPKD